MKTATFPENRYKFIGGNGMKIPRKVLRYFPLTPRLRRLYMSRKTATEMRWYRDKRVDDGIMNIRLTLRSGRNLILFILSSQLWLGQY